MIALAKYNHLASHRFPNLHTNLSRRPTTTLGKSTFHKMLGHKTTGDNSGFECTPEKVKDYLLTLATHLSISEASFFPNNINPSSVFSMSSFNWDKLQDQGAATRPSLCAILHHSACKEVQMSFLIGVLRPVMRDPEYHSLRREVSRLLDLHSAEENLPTDKTDGLDEKV